MNCEPVRIPLAGEIRALTSSEAGLFILTEDRSAWFLDATSLQSAEPIPRKIPLPPREKDFQSPLKAVVGDNSDVYLLEEDGNVWAYFDFTAGKRWLEQIDSGTGTSQILIHDGIVYILKDSGVVFRQFVGIGGERWREDKWGWEIVAGEVDGASEMAVLATCPSEEGGCRTLYIRTDDGRLLRGFDSGQSPVSLEEVFLN